MSFDPCLEWLGFPAVELVSAHAVLGVARGEIDADVIAAAAEERLRILQGIAPGPFGKAHAALIARVVAARDEMLEAVPPAVRQGAGATRVHPPLPSRATFSRVSQAAAIPEMPAIVIAEGPTRRRRSRSGGMGASLAMIAVVAATAAAYVAWPEANARLARKDASPRKVASLSGTARQQPHGAATAAAQHMEPPESEDLTPTESGHREPDRDIPSATSPAPEAPPADRHLPDTAEPTATPLPAAVDTALREAFTALLRKDHDAARQAIDDARNAAGDSDLGRRVDRWDQLVTYAEQLAGHLERAIASANEGREYQIGDRIISIIEIEPTKYAFKESGQTHRGPRDQLPKTIERAILEQWFAADGRAANHILLGVHLLLDDPSRLADVRTEWEIAMAGEPATAVILPLLEDPLLARSID